MEAKETVVGEEEMPSRPPKQRKIEKEKDERKEERTSESKGDGTEEMPGSLTATSGGETSGSEHPVPQTSTASAQDEQSKADEQKSNGGGGGSGGGGKMGGNGKKKKHRRRQRHRRGGKERNSHHHSHKWKPYDKLTWAERQALEERETQRALRVRQERFAIGLAVAPYNTTQFLMEDHNDESGEPKLTPPHPIPKKNKGSRERRCSAPGGIGEEGGSEVSAACPGGADCKGDCNEVSDGADSDEYDYEDDYIDSAFLAKEEEEFSQTYDTIHAESLHNMTKNQLVIEYMELEARLEEMTKNIRRDDSSWPLGQRPYPIRNDGGPVFNYTQSPATGSNGTTTEEEMATLREKVEALEKENKRMKEEMRRLSNMNAASTSATATMTSVDDGGGGEHGPDD